MVSIAIAKITGKGEKRCNGKCGKIKPYSEFYVRSGYGTKERPALLPGHFTTECIECMRERGKKLRPKEPWISLVESENIAIEALMSHGIGAVTGKSANAPDFDVIAWGWIGIEVKYARLITTRGKSQQFTFHTTLKQRDRGLLAHVVMLICEYPGGHRTYHLFDAKAPYFYTKTHALKTGFTFTPDNLRKSKAGRAGHYALTQQVMDAHKDYWGIIGQYLLKLSKQFAEGVRPVYGKPLAA